MAAGRGSRLSPITDSIPKPLLPIDGKASLLSLLESLEDLGLFQVTIVVGYKRQMIETYLKDHVPSKLKISFAIQEPFRSPADAILCALSSGHPHAMSLVCTADTFWPASQIKKLLDSMQVQNASAYIAMSCYKATDAPHGYRSVIDSSSTVIKLLEPIKPSKRGEVLSPSGMHIIGPEVFDLLVQIKEGNIFADAVQKLIDQEKTVKAVEIEAGKELTRSDDLLRYNFPYLRPYL